MPRYVDGFVIPLPKKKLAAYRKISKAASKVWMDHGALEYIEAAGEDMQVKFGMPFPKLVKAKKGETVVFSWIVYKSRAHRDKVNAQAMKDPRLAKMCNPNNMPFEVSRMAYGGFKIFVTG